MVLSGHGGAAAELLKHARAGQDLHIVLELEDYGHETNGLRPGDWRGAWASIGGPKCILTGGRVPRDWEAKAARYAAEGKRHGSVIKDPRTGVAFNDRYVYFFVIDGRWKSSIGMTFTEAGEYCRDVLEATEATLQDGGGSSALWVDGQVRNHVSGRPGHDQPGELRPLANGYFIARVLAPERSDRFQAGQAVALGQNGDLRTGPGSPGRVTASGESLRSGEILPHTLNGVLAKGTYWWYCGFSASEGWVSAEHLRPSP